MWGIITFLLLQLPFFNLGLSYLDEGQLIHDAQRILAGQMPFRDFSLVISPGAFYLQALILKIFGNYLITDRILFLVIQISVIWLATKLFKLSTIKQILLGIILIWPGGFALYNIEAVLLIVISLIAINKRRWLSLGVVAGTIFIFKQSLGVILLPAFLVIVWLETKNYVSIFKFVLGSVITLGLFFGYFIINKAISPLIYHLFVFAKQAKGHEADFIIHRLIFIPVFLVGIRLIKSNKKFLLLIIPIIIIYLMLKPERIGRIVTYLNDLEFWIYSLFTLVPLWFIAINKFRNNSIIALTTFLGIAASGYSVYNALAVAVLFIPLLNIWPLILLAFLNIKQILPPAKIYNSYPVSEINYSVNLPSAKFIKVSLEEKQELETLVKFIQTNTQSDDPIFCYPYCPLIYTLADRPNTSYYVLFYFETFPIEGQSRVISDLQNSKPNLIIMQKPGYIERDPQSAYSRWIVLTEYIPENYKLIKSTPNFEVYGSIGDRVSSFPD
jgi:hypothetical protein